MKMPNTCQYQDWLKIFERIYAKIFNQALTTELLDIIFLCSYVTFIYLILFKEKIPKITLVINHLIIISLRHFILNISCLSLFQIKKNKKVFIERASYGSSSSSNLNILRLYILNPQFPKISN